MKFIFLSLVFSMAAHSGTYTKSDHYDGETFSNPKGNHLHSFFTVMKWKWNSDPVEWPASIENKEFPFVKIAENQKGVATFINHATFLLQFPGLTVLTDPVYSERVSPFSFAGPKRVRQPGVSFETLPVIDVVVISHNHYDHMDLNTLKMIDEKYHPLFLVPIGNAEILKKEGLQTVQELDWWEEFKVRENKITLTPAEHWSARGLFDKNKALWGGFMIQTEQSKVFFAGDTGYGEHFRDIKSRLGAPDLALLPIGAYEPRWFMKFHHMNPEESVQAHIDLGAAKSIGMHFGTFQLTDEGVDDPKKDLVKGREKMNVKEESFMVIEHGESINL